MGEDEEESRSERSEVESVGEKEKKDGEKKLESW
jgi:hypothetical protein